MDSLRSAARRTLHPLSARWSRLPGSLRGAVWTLLAAVGFTGMSVCIKFAGQTMPVWEIIVLRAGFALTIFAPAIARSGLASFRTERFGAHFLRAVFGVLGVSTMMLSITHLDLTLATTLGFTRALFMIVLAVVFLGELIRWRRSIATFVGFIGVVICMQPDPSGIDPWILVGLLAALFAAGVTTMIKRLTATEPPLRIIVLSYLMIGLMAAIPAWAVWKAPTFSELAIIALMGLFSAWGQTCMVHGLRAADATIVVPLDYTRLLYAAIIGFFVFSEVPSWSTWVGGAIIVSSTLYIALREAYLAQQSRPHKPTGE